eukprot:TRINITY_DN10324_c0_g1_i1.p1 TRINITY_DN10324_c0_g1~~TRINITY_DN10324_c0_g1_i1.p1  ORF type:complete len:522 (+),score=70.61 TRINITY_DN10324_c0_g1_i1:38-1603(+)
MSTQSDLSTFHSPTFQHALQTAIESLRKPYVPIEEKRTLLHFIELFCLSETPGIELNQVMKLQQILQSSKTYFPKHERLLLIELFEKFQKVLKHHQTKSQKVDGLSDLILRVQDLGLEENKDEKSKCFSGLVYRTIVHPKLRKTLEMTKAHKWYIEPEKTAIIVFSASAKDDFEKEFCEKWEEDNLLLSKFPSAQVLSLISYNRSDEPTVLAQCATQGNHLENMGINAITFKDGTIGGFLHLRSIAYCITAAHCILKKEQDSAFCVETGETDIALIPVNNPKHGSLFADTSIDCNGYAYNEILTLKGMEVFKIGAITGFTRGFIFGLDRNLTLTLGNPNEGPREWNGMIEILGIPGQRFSEGGDSGSLVYAHKGANWIPIGVLRGQNHRKISESQDSEGYEHEMFAYATPIHRISEVCNLLVTNENISESEVIKLRETEGNIETAESASETEVVNVLPEAAEPTPEVENVSTEAEPEIKNISAEAAVNDPAITAKSDPIKKTNSSEGKICSTRNCCSPCKY